METHRFWFYFADFLGLGLLAMAARRTAALAPAIREAVARRKGTRRTA